MYAEFQIANDWILSKVLTVTYILFEASSLNLFRLVKCIKIKGALNSFVLTTFSRMFYFVQNHFLIKPPLMAMLRTFVSECRKMRIFEALSVISSTNV